MKTFYRLEKLHRSVLILCNHRHSLDTNHLFVSQSTEVICDFIALHKTNMGLVKMKSEVSAGGVVVFGNTILLLKKYNGDWVLPKGRVEAGESFDKTALREVFEETSVKAEIVKYIGSVQYTFRNSRDKNPEDDLVSKTVHWYVMTAKSMHCAPLHSEGFVEAKFVHFDRVLKIMKYADEKKIIRRALKEIEAEHIK